MNRVTQRNYDGLGWTVNENGRKCGGAAIDRLAAYEDTGLEPEEVLKIRNVMAEVAEDYNFRFDFVVRCVLEKTNEPPNDPLTLEELRKMDGKGAWCEDYQCDGIISVGRGAQWEGVPFLICRIQAVNCTYNIVDRGLTIYRRKPEGGDDNA